MCYTYALIAVLQICLYSDNLNPLNAECSVCRWKHLSDNRGHNIEKA